MKFVITIIAGAVFLGACSSGSESNETVLSNDQVSKAWYDVMTDDQRDLFCALYSVSDKNEIMQQLTSEPDAIPKAEAEALYDIMKEEC